MSPEPKCCAPQNDGVAPALVADSARLTILVAEDSADSREMMETLLTTKGFTVVAANDGEHALEVASVSLPDLILVDFRLAEVGRVECRSAFAPASTTEKRSGHRRVRSRPRAISSGGTRRGL
jgi:PleD family two-component response regulator